MIFITLNADEKSIVDGNASPQAALNAIALADGARFILPLAILSDPMLADYIDSLKAFGLDLSSPTLQVDIGPDEFAKPVDGPA